MSTPPVSEPELERVAAASPRERRGAWRRPSGAQLLGLVYVVAAAIYVALALRIPLPSLYPDEFRYFHLAQGLADGSGFQWRGEAIGQSAALYVYFITPASLLFSSTVDAYAASKVMGALAVCTQVVPVWLLGREILGPRRALVPAVLAVAGTWMAAAAYTATEVLAYPLATTTLCVTVMALRRPGARLGFLALAFAALATWARIQLAVLIPVVFAAFLLDAVLAPRGTRRQRLRSRRPVLAAGGAALAVLLAIALAAPSLTGDYAGFFGFRAGIGRTLDRTGLQLLELVVLGGFVPVLLAAVAALSPRAWRDELSGPLLNVFWLAALATAVQSGFFIAAAGSVPTGIERYVTYALPLAFVLLPLLIAERRLLPPFPFLVAGALALLLLAMPGESLITIERAVWATSYRAHQVTGLGHGPALALVGVLLSLAAWALRARLASPRTAATAVALVVLAVFAVQDQATWRQFDQSTHAFRAVMPADLRWVDHASHGPVAVLGVIGNPPQFQHVDFFNTNISQVYVPRQGLPGRPILGRTCRWSLDGATGVLQFAPRCGPAPRRFLLEDPVALFGFYDEARSVRDRHLGRIVEIGGTARPRLRSLLIMPCSVRPTPYFDPKSPAIRPATASSACRPNLSGNVWVDDAATIELRFRGGRRDQSVTFGQQTWTLPANRTTPVRFRVPRGGSGFNLGLDWQSSDGTPRVLSATVTSGGRATSML